MKIMIDKCEYCGKLFENEVKYKKHVEEHVNIDAFNTIYPDPNLSSDNFIQRDYMYLYNIKKHVEQLIGAISCDGKILEPWSYAWVRTINDGYSMYYQLVTRVLNICDKCYKEFNQPYYVHPDHHECNIK